MNQEKFVNTYIELLNTTISEAIQKNIVAQAQKKVYENDISDFEDRIADIQKNRDEVLKQKESQIQNLINDLNDARRKIGQLSTKLEDSKTTSEHLETYVNELVNCRKKNEELVELINQKDKLIAKKDEELKKYGAAPVPTVVNKLGKKMNAPTLETKEPTKTVKIKSVKDAGNF